MTVLRRPTAMPPWAADPAGVSDFGSEVLSLSAMFDDCGSFAAGGAACPGWTGDGGAAYAAGTARLGRRADALSLAARDVATRVLAHADELTALHRRHGDLDERRRELDRLVGRVAAAGDDGATWGLLGKLDAASLDRLVADYERDRRTWIADLAAAERAVARVLGRTLTAADAIASYAGVPDPADAVAGTIPPPGTAPRTVNAWWRGLSAAERLALIAACPAMIGNRDGIPAWARSRANTISLERDLARLGAIPPELRTPSEQRRYANALAADAARTRIEAHARDARTGERIAPQIYLYEPSAFGGDGAVAMAVGDLDTADDVAVTVPGLGTDAGSAPYQSDRAINLHQAMDFEDPAGTHASMFWIGYDAPDNLPWDGGGFDRAGVVAEGMATAGGDRLADTLDGLDAMRDHPAHVTAIGHSYGSTTLGHALHDHHTGVDDAVFVGSPGLGGATDTAADVHVPGHHVWAGANSHDPIPRFGDTGAFGLGSLGGGGLGRNPVEDGFGSIRFRAESVDHGGGLFADHGKYFDPDTESLANIGHIATGDYGHVATAGGVHDPGPDLGDAWDAAGRAADARGHVDHGLTHPWDAIGDLKAVGSDLVTGAEDLGGPLVDPERSRTATAPRTR